MSSVCDVERLAFYFMPLCIMKFNREIRGISSTIPDKNEDDLWRNSLRILIFEAFIHSCFCWSAYFLASDSMHHEIISERLEVKVQ